MLTASKNLPEWPKDDARQTLVTVLEQCKNHERGSFDRKSPAELWTQSALELQVLFCYIKDGSLLNEYQAFGVVKAIVTNCVVKPFDEFNVYTSPMEFIQLATYIHSCQ